MLKSTVMRVRPWGLVVAAAVSAVVGCSDKPTSISVITTTDLPCAALKGVTIRATSPGSNDGPSTTTAQCTDDPAGARIGTLVLVPSGDKDAKVSVRVVAGVDKPVADCESAPGQAGCIVAKRALRFVAGREIDLPIVLRAQCKGTPCDPSSTCVAGVCRSATVTDPTMCSGDACAEGSLEARGSGNGNGGGGGDSGAPTLPDGGSVAPDSGIIVLPDGGITCGASEKICSGACVSQADPAHGCSSAGCDACPGSDVGDYACAAGKCVRLQCKAGFKVCGDTCVPTDVAHGCSAAACTACDATNGTASCDKGACVIACSNGYKLCGGKCVSVDDPTYGCGPTACSSAGCPDPGGGTVICSNGACVIGTCPTGTKQCGQKCVPTDTLNGCQDAARCTACGPFDQCLGAPTVCTCVPETDATACKNKGVECGSTTNRCGGTVNCGGCAAPLSCGGGGAPGKCGCTDEAATTTCTKYGARCGSFLNNCNRYVNCETAAYGTCAAQTGKSGAYCAGNACACTPADPNAVCPSYGCANPDDGCGGYVDCYNYYCCGCGGG